MGDVAVVFGAPAPDGRGMCTLSAPIDLPEEFVWERLVHKVRPLPLNLELPEGSSAHIEQGLGRLSLDMVDKLQCRRPESTGIVKWSAQLLVHSGFSTPLQLPHPAIVQPAETLQAMR
jgi:hypothetical protein